MYGAINSSEVWETDLVRDAKWIHVAQNINKCPAFLMKVMNILSLQKARNICGFSF